jgi:hypothetical protein
VDGNQKIVCMQHLCKIFPQQEMNVLNSAPNPKAGSWRGQMVPCVIQNFFPLLPTPNALVLDTAKH